MFFLCISSCLDFSLVGFDFVLPWSGFGVLLGFSFWATKDARGRGADAVRCFGGMHPAE